jgi:tetratricopeptide (TPR) repeat protein
LTVVYEGLDPSAQQLYRLIPDHPGPDVTVDVLAAALDQPPGTVDEAMVGLFEAHLVTETGPERYALATSVRPHAKRLRMAVDGSALRDAQLRRLITWYTNRAAGAADTIKAFAHRYTDVFTPHRAGLHRHPSPADAQAWFDLERRNITAAGSTAAQLEYDDLLVELTEAIWDPLRTGYRFDDIVDSHACASTAALNFDPALAAVMTARLAFALTSLGEDHDTAISAADEAVDLAHSTDDSWATAVTLSTRARALTAAGRIAEAISDLDAALVLDQQRDDQPSIALRHRRLGQAYLSQGDPARAVPLLQQSADGMDAAGDRAGHARSLTYLAQAYLAAADPDRALDAVHRARGYLEQAGAIRHRVDAGLVTARAHQWLGDHLAADEVCDELLRLLAGEVGPRADARRAEVQAVQDQLG